MPTQIFQSSSTQFTFSDLKTFHTEKLASRATGIGIINNQTSSLNTFMRFLGKDYDHTITSEFGIDFESNLERFIKEASEEKGQSTIYGYKTHLRAWKKSWSELISQYDLKDIPRNFTDALNFCYERAKSFDKNLTKTDLAKRCGIAYSVLRDWFTGRVIIPNNSSAIGKIPALEEALGVPHGTLQNLIVSPSWENSPDSFNGEIEYRVRIKELCEKPYAIKEFNPQLKNEWKALIVFKTSDLKVLLDPDNGSQVIFKASGLNRNPKSSWRTKRKDQYLLNGKLNPAVCSPDENGDTFSQTALIWHDWVSSFFGFLALNKDCKDEDWRGLSMDQDIFSLAYLSCSDLVIEYLNFKKIRSREYSGHTNSFIRLCADLLRKETGFLRQQPDYQSKLPQEYRNERSWDEWCERSRITLLGFLEKLKVEGKLKKVRDPRDPIQEILNLPRPSYALFDMNRRMEERIPYLVGHEKITLKRDNLLTKLLTAHPLRMSHYSIMEYREDNTGHLRKKKDGSWQIRFKSGSFKNYKGAAKKDYIADIPKRLWADLDDYFENVRPYLQNADKCSFVFLPASSNLRKKKN